MKADATDQVGNVVAIKPAGRRQHDEIISPLDQVGRLDGLGLGQIALLFGNELEVVMPDVEDRRRPCHPRSGMVIRPSEAINPTSRTGVSPKNSG